MPFIPPMSLAFRPTTFPNQLFLKRSESKDSTVHDFVLYNEKKFENWIAFLITPDFSTQVSKGKKS